MFGFNIFSGDDWLKLFNVILLAPMQGLCWIVYFCEAVFWTLVVGFKDASGQSLNLIEVVLNGTVTQRIILGSLIAAALMVFLFAIIAIIKQYTTYKEDPNNKEVVGDTLKSIILMVAVPTLALAIIWTINTFTDAMITYLNGQAVDPTNPATSIANHIFVTLGNWKPTIPTTDICFNIGTNDLVENYYAKPTDLTNYQYIIGYVVAFVLFFNLGKAALQAAKRIFDVALLYAVAPLTVSTYPVDKGKRWNVWMNIFLSKMLNVLGMIYAYFIYIALMQTLKVSLGITGAVIDLHNISNSIKNISYILIVVAGAMAVGNAPSLIGHLISEQAGNIATADAQAIDSDLKWGAMMGGKVFGAACNFAKSIAQGSGGRFGGTSGIGGKGMLNGSSALSTFGNKLSTLKHGGISGLHQVNAQAKRQNKLNDLRQSLLSNYGNNLTGAQKAEYLNDLKKFKRMTGNDFSASEALRDAQEKDAMSKLGIDKDFIENLKK